MKRLWEKMINFAAEINKHIDEYNKENRIDGWSLRW